MVGSKKECKLCGWHGPERHRLYHCKVWNIQRLQMAEEVRAMEHIAEGDDRCWLWESRYGPFSWSESD